MNNNSLLVASSESNKKTGNLTMQSFSVEENALSKSSQDEIKTWAEEEVIVDPSIQPYDPLSVPRPFHVTLPGYKESLGEVLFKKGVTGDKVKDSDDKEKEESKDSLENEQDEASEESSKKGPIPIGKFGELLAYPPFETPTWTPSPYFTPQRVGYDWKQLNNYRMDLLPYPNALFEPKDPEASNMYDQMIPWTAYPYGVPKCI